MGVISEKFLVVASEKPLCVRKPSAVFFLENDIPEILEHVHFERSVILLRFSENIHVNAQRDSQEPLRRSSGGPQETLRRLPEAICVSKASDQLCKP